MSAKDIERLASDQQHAEAQVRAILTALREPSEGAAAHASAQYADIARDPLFLPEDAAFVLRAAIDHLLAE